MSKPRKKAFSIEDALTVAEKAREEWLAENSGEDRIKSRVQTILDKRMEETVGKLLGFDTSWGKWELDHCNGRSGNSAAGDFIREKAREAIKEWLISQAGKLPKLHKNAIESMHSSYQDSYAWGLREEIYKLSQANAKKDAEAIMLKITGEAIG
jgi:hypothetical protein